jgi:transcription initiation factor TFIIIB Brf1 subunit/transcription initiation factor TFIIB
MRLDSMVEDKKETRKEDCCENCGGKEWDYDAKLGEKACSSCGLVDINYSPIDGVSDSITQGPERQTEKVSRGSKPGTSGARILPGDLKGVKNPGFWKYEKRKYDSFREKHPFCKKVHQLIEARYGKNVRDVVYEITEMACSPLTAEQEKERSKLTDKGLKKGLGMPKQAVCRLKKGLKGESEHQNAVIIADAIVELAGELGILPKFDRRRSLETNGVTPKQIVSARIIIFNHWKARSRMGWLNSPIPRKSPGEKRYDDIEQAMTHADQMLLKFLPEEVVDKVLQDVSARIQALGEGEEGAITINTEARMLVATLTYASLIMLGCEKGLLARIAKCLYRTGSGVSSSLKNFQMKVKNGALVDNGAFDTDEDWYDEE